MHARGSQLDVAIAMGRGGWAWLELEAPDHTWQRVFVNTAHISMVADDHEYGMEPGMKPPTLAVFSGGQGKPN
jgi:hypothetical protein